MSPLLLSFLLILGASFLVAVLSLRLLRPRDPETPQVELLSERELREQWAAERQVRVAAQARFLGTTLSLREQRAQRQQWNNREYDTGVIAPTVGALTLIALFHLRDDAYEALVMLLVDHLPPPDAQTVWHVFEDLWQAPGRALWSWQGDNTLDSFSETAIKREMGERLATMRGILEVSGWVLMTKTQSARDDVAAAFDATTLHFLRRDTAP